MNLGDIFEEEESRIREQLKNEKPAKLMIMKNERPSNYFISFAQEVVRVSDMITDDLMVSELVHQHFKEFDINRLFEEYQRISDPDCKYTNIESFVFDLVSDEVSTDLMKYMMGE